MKSGKIFLGLIVVLVVFPLARVTAWGESKSDTLLDSTKERWSDTLYYTAITITDDLMGDYNDYSPRLEIEITDELGDLFYGKHEYSLFLLSGSKYDLEHDKYVILDQIDFSRGSSASAEWKINETGDYAVGFKETYQLYYEARVVVILWYWVGERTTSDTTTTPPDASSQETKSNEVSPLNPILVPFALLCLVILYKKSKRGVKK